MTADAAGPNGPRRSRPLRFLAMGLVVLAGLGLRSGDVPLPAAIIKYGGDALWSTMVFVGITAICPRGRTRHLAAAALAFSWGVEFLQLHHDVVLDAIRSTRLGRLALGTTFNPPDLAAYAVGVGLGEVVDVVLSKLQRRSTADGG